MKSRRLLFASLALLLVAALLVSCGGDTPEEPVVEEAAPEEEEMAEEEMAEEEMVMPDLSGTNIVFWHAMSSGANLEGIDALVAEFNNSNEYGITVEAVAQGSQGELETAVNGAITTGELPNLTMGFPNGLSRWYGLGVVAALNDYIDGDYGLSADELAAIYPGPYSSGTLADGTQIGIPMHQSAQVIFYNFTWAEELGFAGPPATSAEFKEQACAATEANNNDDDPDNDGTGGYVYFPDASMVSPWIWAFGGEYVTADGSG